MRRAGTFDALLAVVLLLPCAAQGGAQVYEPIAEAVRGKLSAAIADRSAPELVFRDSEDGHRWIFEMSNRLERRIADRKQRLELLRTVHFEALRAGVDPQLGLGVIEVESGFRK